MPTTPQRSLFWKYAAYFAGLVSALLVMSGGVGGYFAYRQSTAALEELQHAQALFVAREITSFIVRVEEALGATITKFVGSTVTKFRSSDAVDMEDLRLELVALLRHQPAVVDLHWIGTDGRERLTLSRVARDISEGGQDWSNDPRFLAARERSRHFGRVNFREGTEPSLSLAVGHNPGGPVLIAEVKLKFVADIISRIRVDLAGVAYVVDQDGRLVAHPDLSVMLGNNDLSELPQVRRVVGGNALDMITAEESRNLKGMPVLASAVPIPRLGWTVFAEQSLEEALRPVYASIARSIAVVLLGVVAAIAASLVLARRMVRPIHQIGAGAREIGNGRLDQRIDVKTGDELESLAAEFNRAAARLKEIHAMQETRIAERTRDLALANEAKTRFLAAASHDLRQPIHALALFVNQLQAISLSRDGHALAEKIERSVESLEELLEALLDLSKLDVGAITPQPRAFAVHDLLSRLVTECTATAEAKGLALSLVPTSLWVRSDPLLLERILRNLVTNAIRYSVEGRILIGCRRRGGQVDIVIADTGVGIDPAHLPKIFQEFYRVGPLQGGLTKGMGLGLAIVRRLAVLLEHHIAVDSVPGKGTMVRIRLPRAAPEEYAHTSNAICAHDLHGIRVLVVDDEAPARDAMQGVLAQWGCEVITARGGDDAVESTHDRPPDLVLCDLGLADGESGLRVVERLRSAYGSGFACVFITGESARDEIAELRARGYPIMFKPTKPAKLRALIEHLVLSADERL
jgi:signal transduction histidine kinase